MAGNSAGSAIGIGIASFADSINRMLMENERASQAKDTQATQISADKNTLFMQEAKANKEANYTQDIAKWKALLDNPEIDEATISNMYDSDIKNLHRYGDKADDFVSKVTEMLTSNIGRAVVSTGTSTTYAGSTQDKAYIEKQKDKAGILKDALGGYTDKTTQSQDTTVKEAGVGDGTNVTVNLGNVTGAGLNKNTLESDAGETTNVLSLKAQDAKDIYSDSTNTPFNRMLAKQLSGKTIASTKNSIEAINELIGDDSLEERLKAVNESLPPDQKLSKEEYIRQLEKLKQASDPLGHINTLLSSSKKKEIPGGRGFYTSGQSISRESRLSDAKAEATADAIVEIASKVDVASPNKLDGVLRDLLRRSVIDMGQAREIEAKYLQHISPKAMKKEESWLDALLGIRNYKEDMATPFNAMVDVNKLSTRNDNAISDRDDKNRTGAIASNTISSDNEVFLNAIIDSITQNRINPPSKKKASNSKSTTKKK